MRGRTIPLSLSRRLISDLLRASRATITGMIMRRMKLEAVIDTRAACAKRPPWTGIFAKAFAMVADEFPELRRVYLRYPWPHLYEYPVSTGLIAVERMVDGEACVLPCVIKDPAAQPLAVLAKRIDTAANAPVEQVKSFQRVLRIAGMPSPVRRLLWWIALNVGRQRANYLGTFVISVVSSAGSEIVHPTTVWTTFLSYGVFDKDGAVDVRITFDHQVFDGVVVARALARLEEVLNGPIVDELQAIGSAPASSTP